MGSQPAFWPIVLLVSAVSATGCRPTARRAELGSVWHGVTPVLDALPAPPAALPGSRSGGKVALAAAGSRKLVLVADEDGQAVQVVDAVTHAPLGAVALGSRPSQLVAAPDGRVYVALRDKAQVAVLEFPVAGTGEMVRVAQADVATEPVGLATTPDGATLLVTSGWGARLTGLALPDLHVRFAVPLGREPRGVAVTSDGRSAYVTHALGSRISRVDLPDREGEAPRVSVVALGGTDFSRRLIRPICVLPISVLSDDPEWADGPVAPVQFAQHSDAIAHTRETTQGFAVAIQGDRVFAPQVVVVRGEQQVGGYGTSDTYPAHQPALVSIEQGGEAILRLENNATLARKSRPGFEGGHRPDGCMLPRAVAADGARDLVLVSCLGTNEVLAYGGAPDPLSTSLRRRWKVAPGPVGLAIDSDAGVAWVWSQFDRSLSVLDLAVAPDEAKPRFPKRPDAAAPVRVVHLARPSAELAELGTVAQRGRELFHGAGDPRISSDGRACASCHPDGRDDGLTWPTPAGARQTPMLAGRLDKTTAPYGWQGDAPTIAAHLGQTFTRLGGTGLKGADLDALLAYLREMPLPAVPSTATSEAVDRGKALFFSETTGCSTCHAAAVGSDGSRHDIGTGGALETPSLRFVAGTAPYFHDGRYGTLGELLRGTKGKMGWAREMDDADLSALEAYLTTL